MDFVIFFPVTDLCGYLADIRGYPIDIVLISTLVLLANQL
jgi:hypothetical protein